MTTHETAEVRRIQYEDRIYVDLEDLKRLCRFMSELHNQSGMIAPAMVMEEVAQALAHLNH